MMSLETINYINAKQSRKAKNAGKKPLKATCDGDENIFKMPNLGYYIPKDYELIETLFVDKTGFGSENEPALTIKQFLSKVKKDLYYAIYEEGQFQVYIGVYQKN